MSVDSSSEATEPKFVIEVTSNDAASNPESSARKLIPAQMHNPVRIAVMTSKAASMDLEDEDDDAASNRGKNTKDERLSDFGTGSSAALSSSGLRLSRREDAAAFLYYRSKWLLKETTTCVFLLPFSPSFFVSDYSIPRLNNILKNVLRS